MSRTKLAIKSVYKIFGYQPLSALDKAIGGLSKEQILEETGHTLALRNVSLDVNEGETFVIMGLSGSGKSTLIRHINRLIEPTSGRVLVDGRNVLSFSNPELLDLRRRTMSMVFQHFGLLPHKTVLENVAYGPEIAGLGTTEARRRAALQIELVGLVGYEHQYPRQLSGGMQQRVGLARALATDAEILLMDEAFSALDPLIRTDMQSQLIDLQQRLRKTIVFITHDLDEALRIGDRIAILKDGEVRQLGTPEEILLHPADEYVGRFVRDVNRMRVITMGSIAFHAPNLTLNEASRQALEQALLFERCCETVYILDEDRRPLGVVTAAVLQKCNSAPGLGLKGIPELLPVTAIGSRVVLDEALAQISGADVLVAVVDDAGRYVGAASMPAIVRALASPATRQRT